MAVNNIITYHEKQLIALLLKQERSINSIFNEFINSISGDLRYYRQYSRGNVWARNSSIEKAIEKKLVELHSNLTALITENQSLAIGYSADKTKAILGEYVKNLGIAQTIKSGILNVRAKSLETFEKRKLAGMNLSSNVWTVTENAKTQIEFFLEGGLASGRSAKEIARDVKALLKDPDKRFRRIRDPNTGKLKLSAPMMDYHPGAGRYRSSYKNALRMTATEINMAYRYSDVLLWQEKEFIMGYEVKLSSQHPVFDICDHMAGQYPKSFIFGGWHPNCICYAVPIMLPPDDFVRYLKTDKVPAAKRIKTMPKKGEQYFKSMIDRYEKNYSSLPYWVENNFKKVKGVWVQKF